MSSPYLQRVKARMEADDAVSKLHRHWSARGERYVNRIGYYLEQIGLERLSSWYVNLTYPLVEWFGDQQRRFLRRYL